MDGWKRILSFWMMASKVGSALFQGRIPRVPPRRFSVDRKLSQIPFVVDASDSGPSKSHAKLAASCTQKDGTFSRWWFEAFLCIFDFTPNPGEMILFDKYFLQVGWNHQLVLHMIWVILLMVQESGFITSWYGEYLIFSQQFIDNRWYTQKDGRFGDTSPQKLSRIPSHAVRTFEAMIFPTSRLVGELCYVIVVSRRVSLIFQFPNKVW